MMNTITLLLASLCCIQSLTAQEAPPILTEKPVPLESFPEQIIPIDPLEPAKPSSLPKPGVAIADDPLQPIPPPTDNAEPEIRAIQPPTPALDDLRIPQVESKPTRVDPSTPSSYRPASSDPKITVIKLSTMQASEMRKLIEELGMLEEGLSVAVEQNQNLLLFRGDDQKISNIQELVKLLDTPTQPKLPAQEDSAREAMSDMMRGQGGGRSPSAFGGNTGSFGGGRGARGGGRPQRSEPTSETSENDAGGLLGDLSNQNANSAQNQPRQPELARPTYEESDYQPYMSNDPLTNVERVPLDITALRTLYEKSEREAAEIAQKLREQSDGFAQNHPQQLVLRRELYKSVRDAFNHRQNLQRLEIQKARRDLDLIEQRLERREKISDAIIKHRVEELQSGGDLSWAHGRPQASNSSKAPLRQGTPQSSRPDTPAVMKGARNFFGMDLQEIRPDPADQDPMHRRLMVTAVHAESPADKVGIQTGDLLMGLDRWETLSLEHILFVHDKLVQQRATKVKFYIVRNGERLTGELEFPQRLPRTHETSATERQNSDELLGEWRFVSQQNIDGPVGTVPDDARILIDRTTIREVANGYEKPVWLYQRDGSQLFVVVAPRTNDQLFARCACEVKGDTLWLAFPEDFESGGSSTIPEEANPRVLMKNVIYLKLERASNPALTAVKSSQEEAAIEATREQLLGTWKVVSHTLGNKWNERSVLAGTYDEHLLKKYDHLIIERPFIRWVADRELERSDFYQVGSNQIDLYSIDDNTSTLGVFHIEGDTLWIALSTQSPGSKETIRPKEVNPFVRRKTVFYLELHRVSPVPGEIATRADDGRNSAEVQFHGLKDRGSKIVYLIDCSASMASNNALDIAKAELLASLNGLSETQQFQVIFYNEKIHELRFESAGSDLLFATRSNRNHARRFIQSIQPSQGTQHFAAVTHAREFYQPDVLFLLTDAQEATLNSSNLFVIQKQNRGRTHIHCVEFGRGDAAPADNYLKQLSRENGGTYTHRDVTRLDHAINESPILVDPAEQTPVKNANAEQLLGEWKLVSQTMGDEPTAPGLIEIHLLIDRAMIRWVIQGLQQDSAFYQVDANQINLINIESEISTRGIYQLEGNTLWLALGTDKDDSQSSIRPADANPKVRSNSVLYLKLERISSEVRSETVSQLNMHSTVEKMSGTWKILKLGPMPVELLKGATAAIDSESILLHVPSQDGEYPHPHFRYTIQPNEGIDVQMIEDGEPQETLLGKYQLREDSLRIVFHNSESPKTRPVDVTGKVPQKDVIVLELEKMDLPQTSATRTTIESTPENLPELDSSKN